MFDAFFPDDHMYFSPPRPPRPPATLSGEARAVPWTREEDKVFESSLVQYPEDTPGRWGKIAALLPGKTAGDVADHYAALLQDVTDIEAGRVAVPGYPDAAAGDEDYDGGRKRKEERKKGVPWTEDEHRRFLEGLERFGKGDWRSILRNAVVTRTPTQVASHAQKYFIRLNSSGKRDKKRGSIHDITTATTTATH